ncbi:MAG: hypothetical protein JSW64_10365 [Candidatus Zixiibacteriota bacterium]|nr:MAG: hypothetical protein JSW64_10365 [candidate division Zixibacteria bacterium]
MERRKIIIYSIFIIVAAYGFYFHFLSGETDKNTSAPLHTDATIRANISEVETELAKPSIKDTTEQKATLRSPGNRNPFENNNINQGVKISSGKPVRYARPIISAISVDGSGTFVIANNKVIKIGEKIGVWKLVKAESERALFDGPDGSIWVNLGG